VISGDADDERAVAWLEAPRSEMCIEQRKLLTWDFSDHGFRAHVDEQLPEAIGSAVAAFVERAVTAIDELELWCVHPGGAAILDRVERALSLPELALADSREVLRRFGNMSSATIFFVLERALARGRLGRRGLMLGFGTGLTLEALPFVCGPRAGSDSLAC
jgi:predicted naringenin-chalcone synthase